MNTLQQHGTLGEDNFSGIIINSTEVETHSLSWVPVNAKFTFTNKTGKEIKYITFDIRPYNVMGTPVECTVSGVSLYKCKCTGPFAPNGTFTQILESAWCNTTIASVKIESAKIIYMDDSTETLTSRKIKCLSQDASIERPKYYSHNETYSKSFFKGFFQNPGKKLQWFAIVDFISSIVAGIICAFVFAQDIWGNVIIWQALAYLMAGFCGGYITSVAVYAFGSFIVDTAESRETLARVEMQLEKMSLSLERTNELIQEQKKQGNDVK